MKKILNGNYGGDQTITVGVRTLFKEIESLEETPEDGRSKLEKVELVLAIDDPLMRAEMFNSHDQLTQEGQETITNTLVAGIVEQIISCEAAGTRGWQNHFDYILSCVVEGLAHRLPKGTVVLDAEPNDPDQYEADPKS